MRQGVVFFAFNSSSIDYIKIAEWNAQNIQRHLGLPVTLITDTPTTSQLFDQVILVENIKADHRIFFDQENLVPWRNRGRCAAYELSPYDTTLLLDVDYIVASNQLLHLIADPREFICHQHAIEITQTTDPVRAFGQHHMPMSWATVIKFDRSKVSKNIFDIMSMVQNNYSHYANLYKFRNSPFRNDYALSIAITLVNGHVLDDRFNCNWPLLNVNPGHEVCCVAQDCYEIKYTKMVNKELKPFKIMVRNQDIHIMGKSYLENLIAAN